MGSMGSMGSKGWAFRLPMLVFSPMMKEMMHKRFVSLGISFRFKCSTPNAKHQTLWILDAEF
jgi:hypothetical protein